MDADFNIKLYKLFSSWNPMHFEDATLGDTEVYECMDIIHQKLSEEETIQRIKDVYLHAFDEDVNEEEVRFLLVKVQSLKLTCNLS